MSLLIFTLQRQRIISFKSQMNMKMMVLKKKMLDLQTYATSIADGTVSMSDLMKSPGSMFGRMSIFMMASHESALQGANQKMAYMSQIQGAMPNFQDANQAQAYQQMMYKSLYDQAREKSSEREQKVLNQQETKIQSEIADIETKLKMFDAEEEKITAAEDKAAQKSAAYVA